MCALAELVLRAGGQVSGCDVKTSAATRRLEGLGVEVLTGHDPEHVDGATAVVVTSAVDDAHPELARAREAGVPVMKRARALGDVVNRGRVVAAAGTHGKTTTTALATDLLTAAGFDPTGLVGGAVPAWEGNLRPGSDGLYVVEADEYDRSFHTLEPDVAAVTNIEADHLDVYEDLEGVRAGFRTFLERVREGGRVVVCADDPGASALLTSVPGKGYSYGLSAGSQLRAVDVETSPSGSRFTAVEDGVPRGELHLSLPGLHNLRNGLAAAACARHLGAGWDAIRAGLAGFTGVGRRFERLGERGGIAVIDDYAHHPTEVRATLEAVRSVHPGRRVVALFQPHLYSRTRDFAEDFGAALAGSLAEGDVLWLTDVFPAREEPIPGVTGELVVRAATEAAGARGPGIRYHASLEGLAEVLADELAEGDVLVAMGAGSVEEVAPAVLARLTGRSTAGEAGPGGREEGGGHG
jgi:UDP-N-acetylmuramate--alanine ligase